MNFATLTCQRDLELALCCLPSLVRHAADFESLTIFEDGTLTGEGAARLAQALPESRLVRRAAMNEAVASPLAKRPACRAFRRENPLALKLLDIPFLLPPGTVFVDCDIRFFGPFRSTSLAAAQTTHFIFMKDPAQGYSARLLDLIIKHRLRMPANINTGIFSRPPGWHDLDFIEWFLRIPEFRVLPTLVEQTCWAALAGERPAKLLNPRQVRCAGTAETDETVAVHYIAGHKDKAAIGADLIPAPEPCDLRLVSTERLTLRRALAHTLSRRWRRLRA